MAFPELLAQCCGFCSRSISFLLQLLHIILSVSAATASSCHLRASSVSLWRSQEQEQRHLLSREFKLRCFTTIFVAGAAMSQPLRHSPEIDAHQLDLNSITLARHYVLQLVKARSPPMPCLVAQRGSCKSCSSAVQMAKDNPASALPKLTTVDLSKKWHQLTCILMRRSSIS